MKMEKMDIVHVNHQKKKVLAEQRSYLEVYQNRKHGKSSILIECPFCNDRVTAYCWSLASSGKKCSCGAMFNSAGMATKVIEPILEVKT